MIEKNTELRKNISKSQIKSDEKYARKKKMVTNVKIIFKTKKKEHSEGHTTDTTYVARKPKPRAFI